jgi:hypothetical protein
VLPIDSWLSPQFDGLVSTATLRIVRERTEPAPEEQVRLARRRFGRYEVIDFVAVLFGYAISGERTLEAFYQGLLPWASAFMALFGRDRLPARSTLSRFPASLDQAAVRRGSPFFCKICWPILPCPLREQCQWHGRAATKPRRVSGLLHPVVVGSVPLFWRDWIQVS